MKFNEWLELMTQERMEKLYSMAISEDEKVRKLCQSILVNGDFNEYSKIHFNHQTLDIDDVEPFYILAAELILNKENYDYKKFGLNIDKDEKGSIILGCGIYIVIDKAKKLIKYVIGPKLIKK